MEIPKPYEIYRHFKGDYYMIECVALDSEDLSKKVVYRALYDSQKIYVRDLDMFMSEIDTKKYPDAEQRKRFEKIDFSNSESLNFKSEKEEFRDETLNPEENVQPENSEKEDTVTLFNRFLDSNDNDEMVKILAEIEDELTDPMVTTIEFVMGMEEGTGSRNERIRNIRQNLAYKCKYEKKNR